MNNQKGFTLIELIVVIVILGILSAVAVPKFIDMQDDAKKATLEGARGAVKSAMGLTHAKSLIDGTQNAAADAANLVKMEGVDVLMAYGYPTAAGIVVAASLATDFDSTGAGTVASPLLITVDTESASGTTYSFAYKAATSATVPAAVSTVVIGTTYTY